MKEEIVASNEKIYEGTWESFLLPVRDFFDRFIAPHLPRLTYPDFVYEGISDEYYNQFQYFNQKLVICEGEVLYQVDDGGKLVGFVAFGRRFPKDEHITIYCISVHPEHRNVGRAKVLLHCVTERAKELGFTKIRPGEPVYQPWDTGQIGRWSKCIANVLQNSGLDIIN